MSHSVVQVGVGPLFDGLTAGHMLRLHASTVAATRALKRSASP